MTFYSRILWLRPFGAIFAAAVISLFLLIPAASVQAGPSDINAAAAQSIPATEPGSDAAVTPSGNSIKTLPASLPAGLQPAVNGTGADPHKNADGTGINKNATGASSVPGVPPTGLDPAWRPLIDRLTADDFDHAEMEELFARLGPSSYSPAFMATKITELYGVGGIGIRRNDDAPPVLPEGYEQPLSDMTVGSCKAFMIEYAKELEAIKGKHGVPANVIVGLLLVETGLGSDLGNDSALRALAGMAATTTPAMLAGAGNSAQIKRVREPALKATLKNKSDWAYNEVKALIRNGKANDIDVSKTPGSMYGAVGICQFMPSNIEPYGVDGDGDGKVDLFTVVDAMYSAANYLEAHGWRGAKNSMSQFWVIRSYNQDNIYAARVLGVSNHIAMAVKGKISDRRNAMAGIGPVPASALDPSLRRRGRVPVSARVKPLGSYEPLVQ